MLGKEGRSDDMKVHSLTERINRKNSNRHEKRNESNKKEDEAKKQNKTHTHRPLETAPEWIFVCT